MKYIIFISWTLSIIIWYDILMKYLQPVNEPQYFTVCSLAVDNGYRTIMIDSSLKHCEKGSLYNIPFYKVKE